MLAKRHNHSDLGTIQTNKYYFQHSKSYATLKIDKLNFQNGRTAKMIIKKQVKEHILMLSFILISDP